MDLMIDHPDRAERDPPTCSQGMPRVEANLLIADADVLVPKPLILGGILNHQQVCTLDGRRAEGLIRGQHVHVDPDLGNEMVILRSLYRDRGRRRPTDLPGQFREFIHCRIVGGGEAAITFKRIV